MKKRLAFSLIATSLLLACTDKPKDAEYYYEHPDELRQVGTECDAKIKSASDQELDQLANDETCKNAMLATQAIKLGDLKKAILLSDEQGWEQYIKYVKDKRANRKKLKDIEEENLKKLAKIKRDRAEKKATEEKADADDAKKLIDQSEGQTWAEFLKDKPIYSSCKKGSKLCEATQQLIKAKKSDALKFFQETNYKELITSKDTYCDSDIARHSKLLCNLWSEEVKKKKEQLINDYINNERKLRADYQACYDNVHQYKKNSTNPETNKKREQETQNFPCPIVGEAASKKYNNVYYFLIDKELP